LKPAVEIRATSTQMVMFEDEIIREQENKIGKAIDSAYERERVSRSIFAQHAIKADSIEEDLDKVDEAIGGEKTPEEFVTRAIRYLDGQMDAAGDDYAIYPSTIPARMRLLLPDKPKVLISFRSPTPQGHIYIGRNHPLTEQLCQTILSEALRGQRKAAARAAVVRTNEVKETTVVFQFRVRNVIAEKKSERMIVAEEMWLWGYEGPRSEGRFFESDRGRKLLLETLATSNVSTGEQQHWLQQELGWIHSEEEFKETTDPVALRRATELVEAHHRFSKVVKSPNFRVVEPILPMDVLGVYIYLPELPR
jgi:hypothetical protein